MLYGHIQAARFHTEKEQTNELLWCASPRSFEDKSQCFMSEERQIVCWVQLVIVHKLGGTKEL